MSLCLRYPGSSLALDGSIWLYTILNRIHIHLFAHEVDVATST